MIRTLTLEQMDHIIAAYKAAYPQDFGDAPTWEREEAAADAAHHTSGGHYAAEMTAPQDLERGAKELTEAQHG